MTRSAGCSQNYNTISHQHSLLTPTPLVSRDTTGRIIGDRMDAGGEPADDLPVCAGNFQGANKGSESSYCCPAGD